ncbi:MAG: sulfur carrier protein ThiS [Planctomycetota bacterium]|jgi:thiamine biosynthesis protein ThiS
MATLKINGVEKEFAGGIPATVAELLGHLGIEAATVVAEIDGQIIERARFPETQLRQGQAIELVRFVPGG